MRPKKKQLKPAVKMRGLAWSKIDDKKIDDTIWDQKINDEAVQLDIKELEALFCAVTPPKPEKEEGGAGAGPAKAAKKQVITLLDPRRSNNCSIMLSRFGKMPYADIAKAVKTLDESVLSMENVSAMKQFVPTSEEIEILKEYTGDKSQLGKAERYFLEIMTVPKLAQRLSALHTKLSFQGKYEGAKESLDVLVGAVKEIRSSKLLPKMMELVLAIGNFLNGGTFRGGAYGFKLDTLVKMGEVKGVDPKLTMMHYLAQTCESKEKYKELLEIGKEFPSLQAACRESIPQCGTELNKLKGEISSVGAILKGIEDNNDPFKKSMSNFHEGASAEIDASQKAHKKLEEDYKALLKYFGENPSTDSQSLFNNVYAFIQSFEKAHKDNGRRKQMAEKAKLAEKRRAEMAAKIAAKRKAGGGKDGDAAAAPKGPPAGGRNVLDNLIADMRTGQAFAPPTQNDIGNEALAMFARLKKRREQTG